MVWLPPQFDVPQFEPTSFPKFIGSTSFLFAIHIVVRPPPCCRDSRESRKACLTACVRGADRSSPSCNL